MPISWRRSPAGRDLAAEILTERRSDGGLLMITEDWLDPTVPEHLPRAHSPPDRDRAHRVAETGDYVSIQL